MAIAAPGEGRGRDDGEGKRTALLTVVVLGVIAAVAACSLITPFTIDDTGDTAPEPDGDAGGDGYLLDADQQGDALDGGFTGPGPLTFVIKKVAVSTKAVFDLDGDGHPDNAVGDLGEDNAKLFAAALDGLLEVSLEEVKPRLLHFPWIRDRRALTEEHALLLYLTGGDLDSPPDRTDDDDGGEPFFADPDCLTPCGEPEEVLTDGSVRDGTLEGFIGSVDIVPLPGQTLPLTGVQAGGNIAADGRSTEMTLAGVLAIADLGGIHGLQAAGDLNLLEVFLAGGLAFGFPTLPGVNPDLDLDGDGLERFLLTDSGEIALCIDGDTTVIDGRDCWQDPRMGDAFALTMDWSGVWAVFEGRQPGWREAVAGECTDPPEHSLFDPPAEG